MKNLTLLGVAILAVTALSACGGGGASYTGNTNTTPTAVIDSGLIIDSGRGISNN